MVTRRSTAASTKAAKPPAAKTARKRTPKKVAVEPAKETEPSFNNSVPTGEDGLDPVESIPIDADSESCRLWIKLDQIVLDEGTQLPGRRSEDTIAEYTQEMLDDLWNWTREPLPVFYRKDNKFYPGDGHHRVEATERAGRDSICGEVREGGLLKAKLHSAQANKFHGLPLTNRDKRAKCEMVFNEPDLLGLLAAELGQPGSTPSDRVVALYLGVSAPLVGQVRKKHEAEGTVNLSSQRTDKRGRTIDTEKIGKKATAPDVPPQTIVSNAITTTANADEYRPEVKTFEEHTTTEEDIDRNAKLDPNSLISPFEQKVIKQAIDLYKPEAVLDFVLGFTSDEAKEALANLLNC